MIQTARLLLRPARESDADAFHTILSDRRAMRYWSTLPHETPDQTREWVRLMIGIPANEGEDWVIDLDGTVIGKAGLWRFPAIGYILHPDYWGRGYAREALTPVLARAFAVHGLSEVTADVDPRNVASVRLLTSLGFVETGRATRDFRLGDEWCDSVYLALRNPG